MSKSIAIKEGGTGKQMTVNKLKTDVVGGGTCLWVPEDETQLTTKSITENGIYKASDDEKYGYSQVSVHVPGGKGSADSSGLPTDDVLPGGIGCGIVGADEDGNESFMGVDEDGNFVSVPLPSSIVILVEPSKMEYESGETISLVGATIVAKNADGTTWTNADYPNGHIPIGEISLEPNVAESGAGSGATVPSDNPFNVSSFVFGSAEPSVWWQDEERGGSYHYSEKYVGFKYAMIGFFAQKGNRHILASDTPYDKYYGYGISNDPANMPVSIIPADSPSIGSYTYNNKTVYFCGGNIIQSLQNTDASIPINYDVLSYPDNDTYRKIAWLMVYGGYASDSQTITLKWARPADKKLLTTTMQIDVTPSETTQETGNDDFSGGESGF